MSAQFNNVVPFTPRQMLMTKLSEEPIAADGVRSRFEVVGDSEGSDYQIVEILIRNSRLPGLVESIRPFMD